MRKARHFVGVHWQPRTRLVAFGPVAAMVTLADGSEHEVRATSTRVWTDVELPEHPTHVRLRVLDETEAEEPPPPVTLGAAPRSGTSGPGDDPVTDQPPVDESTVDDESPSAATPPVPTCLAPGARRSASEPMLGRRCTRRDRGTAGFSRGGAAAGPGGADLRWVRSDGAHDLALAAQLGAALAVGRRVGSRRDPVGRARGGDAGRLPPRAASPPEPAAPSRWRRRP